MKKKENEEEKSGRVMLVCSVPKQWPSRATARDFPPDVAFIPLFLFYMNDIIYLYIYIYVYI